MNRSYQRSPILGYNDLTEDQQIMAYNEDNETCENSNFVLWNNEPLNLGHFEPLHDGKLWHGTCAQSAFSAYMIRINRQRTEATVVFSHW